MGCWRLAAVGSLAVAVLAATACRPEPDLAELRAEILALHRRDIEAHLTREAAVLAEPTSPDYISAASGRVDRMQGTEMERMLSDHLASTEFSHSQDVAEPIIGISSDGSLAWAVVQVRVAGTSFLEDGSSRAFDTLWAWLTLSQRCGDGWLRVADVSTNRPFGPDG